MTLESYLKTLLVILGGGDLPNRGAAVGPTRA